MNNICIITIFKSFDKELENTLNSIRTQTVLPSRLILVGHANKDEENKIKQILNLNNDSLIKIEMIINQDKSLFNAMNIAIQKLNYKSKEKHFLFLNSGDILLDEFTVLNLSYLSQKFENKCIATQCILTKDNLKFIRPGKFNSKIINWPHQGFLAPIINDKKIFLDEKNIISADRKWMYKLSKLNSVIFSPLVTSIHNLDGVSSVINFNGLRTHYIDSGFFKFIKYLLKYLLSFLLSTNLLLIIIYKFRGYIKIK